MRIVNEKYETIAEYDLNKGYLAPCVIIKPDAEPLSDSKPVWADEDWEEVQVYYPYDWAKDGADIEAFRNEVIETMAKECERQIISGIEVDGHKFSLEYSDQIAMMKLLMNIQAGATSVQWHPDDEDCNTYSSQKFAEIAAKADAHVTWHQTYFNSLKKYLKAAETVDQLAEAVYGMDIPDAYQTAALQALIAKKDASCSSEIPMNLAKEEFVNNLVSLVNNSRLPSLLVESILSDTLAQIKILNIKQLEADCAAWKADMESSRITETEGKSGR